MTSGPARPLPDPARLRGLEKWMGQLWCDWEEPPEAMDFERSYAEVLSFLGEVWDRIRQASHPAPWDCLCLYCTLPALVNVALNHMIAVEHALPLHPTLYFPIDEAGTWGLAYSGDQRRAARELYLDAIDLGRDLAVLHPEAGARLEAFRARVPAPILDFRYTSTRDRYTWRASEPDKLRTLAANIRAELDPVLLVGAAHGAIMPGLALAELLDVPIYFVRFSLFKRHDKAPILSPGDLAHLDRFRAGPVVLFDEDVAKGTTLTLFTERLGPLFSQWRSAALIRHVAADFVPDIVGHTWRG